MCLTTLYDSPTCGHTWLSLSHPCTYLADLLSCPIRSTTRTLIAPPHTCPICNHAFADPETIEMVQGPWGCNQMLRNAVGGGYAVPGQWGSFSVPMGVGVGGGGHWGPALTSGYTGAPLSCPTGFNYDHRLTGLYEPAGGAPLMLAPGPGGCAEYGWCDDGHGYGYAEDGYFLNDDEYDGHGWGGGRARSRSRSRSKHKSKYKYRYEDRATNCVVM